MTGLDGAALASRLHVYMYILMHVRNRIGPPRAWRLCLKLGAQCTLERPRPWHGAARRRACGPTVGGGAHEMRLISCAEATRAPSSRLRSSTHSPTNAPHTTRTAPPNHPAATMTVTHVVQFQFRAGASPAAIKEVRRGAPLPAACRWRADSRRGTVRLGDAQAARHLCPPGLGQAVHQVVGRRQGHVHRGPPGAAHFPRPAPPRPGSPGR